VLTKEKTIPKISTSLLKLYPPLDKVQKIPKTLLTNKTSNAGFIGRLNWSIKPMIIAIGKAIPPIKKTSGTVSQYKMGLNELNQLSNKLAINHTIAEDSQYAGNKNIHLIMFIFLPNILLK